MIPNEIKVFLVMLANGPKIGEYWKSKAAQLLAKYVKPAQVGPSEFKEVQEWNIKHLASR